MTTPAAPYCIPIGTGTAAHHAAGGKGANLDRLAHAGFPVPPGFIIQTSAYDDFVARNRLLPVIDAALQRCSYDDPQSLEDASQQIGSAFASGVISPDVSDDIRQAYQRLSGSPVAVRSSATAEDLPDLSFAGQQETILNVVGEARLFDAVIRCWASLWTARAIGYRARNGIPQRDITLAVVVQQMVQSTASGVMFTANPLTGLLSETVINAVNGLGEALVSGMVEPDYYVVDAPSGKVREERIGAKALEIRGATGGGVKTVPAQSGQKPALTHEQITHLAGVGAQIQSMYQSPQDVEWAYDGDRLHILQSRPITSLFPIPAVSTDPLDVWFSFGSVQGLLGPMTPLGRDLIQQFPVGAGIRRLFHLHGPGSGAGIIEEAGERLWIKITPVLRNPLGFRPYTFFIRYVEPSIGRLLAELAAEPGLGTAQGRLKIHTLRRMVLFFGPVVFAMLRTLHSPEKARAAFDAYIEDRLRKTHIPAGANRFERLANFVNFWQDDGYGVNIISDVLPRFIAMFGPSMGMFNLLSKLSGNHLLAMEVMRAVPGNVTTQMDLALWRVAAAIRSDAASARVFHEAEADTLARDYLEGNLPAAAQIAISQFMQDYGMRGVAEFDFGQPRWREAPAPVMHTLKSYLNIPPERAPDVQFARGEQAARAAVEEIVRIVRNQPAGWLKTRLVRAAARRVRALIGARESPKFSMIRTMGIARQALLAVGNEFAAAGTIEQAGDLVFLKLAELRQMANQEPVDWKKVISARKAAYQRETRRSQVPRVLVSDGRALYEGVSPQSDSSSVITGSPVSPGIVEGVVRVVFDPRQTRLLPGEILVCPGTDPAWTPLFLSAGGLITEVGGMMTHGSVVAREYGIPAVVGVHQATIRLLTGQRVRVNGNTGEILTLTTRDEGVSELPAAVENSHLPAPHHEP